MPQVTVNQNTKLCTRRIDTQNPIPVTQCLTATSITSSTSDRPGNTGIAFCSYETVCSNASVPLGNTSRSGVRTDHIEKCVVLEKCSAAHPRGMQHAQTVLCWSQNVLQQLPVSSGSGCESSVVFAVTAVWPDDSDHTAHCTVTVAEGRQVSGTSEDFLDANDQSFARSQTPKDENRLQQTFIRSMCANGCVTPTTPHKQLAPSLATVPSLTGVPAINKLQQDSQCT